MKTILRLGHPALSALVALVALFFIGGTAPAQTTIKGEVIDSSGLPVIGAGVLQTGTTNGVITDIDGRFTLSVPANASVTVTSIAYKDAVFTVDGRTSYKIVLEEDSEMLEGVEVVAYGTQKKVTVTSSM